MKIICNGPTAADIVIWTDDGIDITRDLDPDEISFVMGPDGANLQVVITCPVKGFVIDGGLSNGEPTIVENTEVKNEDV